MIPANMFHNTSLKANHTHRETPEISNHMFIHIISKLMNSVNSISTQNNILPNNLAIFSAHAGFVSWRCFVIFLLIIFVIIFEITVKIRKTMIHVQILSQYETIILSVILLVQDVSCVVCTFVSSILLV